MLIAAAIYNSQDMEAAEVFSDRWMDREDVVCIHSGTLCESGTWKSLSRVQLYHMIFDTVHGILRTTILEWVAFPFSGGSSQPGDWTQVSRIAGGFFTSWATIQPLKKNEMSMLHVSFWSSIFSGYMPRSGIAGYYFSIIK